ncbi:hypothetical protein [Bordetella sp. FB-8]|uniref:hypothetical protein n=1 Tax=Bordetella sp. FB-8 TaxID=1159870 RepID=UPI0012DD2C5E|nr:hypothetical protein [Bordetella sp. FB-8]
MIDALDDASSFQLQALIEGMLANPKRMMEACTKLHPGVSRFSMTAPGESLVVGDKVELATQIARIEHELGGVSRICLQMATGPIDREIGSVQLKGWRRADETLRRFLRIQQITAKAPPQPLPLCAPSQPGPP